MAVFRVQIHYAKGTVGKWSNVWHVDADGLADAAFAVTTIMVPGLLPLLHNDSQLVSTLVTDLASNAFITTPVNANGTSADADSMLPLYNSVKVLFPSPTFGRPDYKYLKGFLTEVLNEEGNLSLGTPAAIQAAVSAIIADMSVGGVPLVSRNGEGYGDVAVQVPIQMRQMHRKRRRVVVTP